MPIKNALSVFGHLAFMASELLAFKSDYDRQVLTGEYLRAKLNHPFDARPVSCVMKPMVDICKLPKPGGHQSWHTDLYKWPKLIEAYRHCFNEEMQGAHDALADVRATARIHFWLQASKQQSEQPIS